MTQTERNAEFIRRNSAKVDVGKVANDFVKDQIRKMIEKYSENPSDSAKVEN